MSMLRKSNSAERMWSMFCSDPVSRLSMQITLWPCPSRCSQRWEPRNPAPPVTTQVLTRARLQASPTTDDLRDALNAHLHHPGDRRDRHPVVVGAAHRPVALGANALAG